MSDKIFKDYGKIDFSTKAGRDKVFAAVQYFATERKKEADKALKQVQAFGSTGDFPTSILPLIEKFHAQPYYDQGYQEVFDIRDFTGTRRNGFEILDVEDGLTFAKVQEGNKAQIFKMAGSKATVNFDLYGGGLGWHRTLIDDEEYWTLEDNARSFVNKAYENQAASYYALIEAVASTYNVSWQTALPSGLSSSDATYTANRDIQTINAACLQILKAVKDYGWGVTAQNAQFVIVTPLDLYGRINRALALAVQAFQGSQAYLQYKIRVVPTMMFSTLTSYYVILPKFKMKGGNRMNLTIFNKFDEESYTDVAVGWMRYGGAIGDIKQIARCATS